VTSKKLTIPEAAKQARVSERTIQRWFAQGLRHEVGVDRKKRVTLTALQAHVRKIAATTRVRDHLTKKYVTRRNE